MGNPINAWSVKGVSEQARALAKQAAAEAGLSLGQWLNQTLMDHANHKNTNPPPSADHVAIMDRDLTKSASELQQAIATLDKKLHRLEAKMQNDLTILHRHLCQIEDQAYNSDLAKSDKIIYQQDRDSRYPQSNDAVQASAPHTSLS